MIRVSQPVTGPEELEALKRGLEKAYFGHSADVVELEKALAGYLGAGERPVVCVNSGTAALHLALACLDLAPGDEVLVPSLTFVASFQAITAVGAKPVSCEVREDDLLLDLDDAQRRITPRTKAVMPVHYAGNPGDLDGLYAWAAERGLRVVEDAAHAFGSSFGGKKVGAQGDLVCFSFDSLKNITCGEGGALVCPDADTARRAGLMRGLGMERPQATQGGPPSRSAYDVVTQGWRFHMSNLNALVGLEQLKKAPAFFARRQAIAKRYDQAFADVPGLSLLPMDYDRVVPFLYTLRVLQGRRAELIDHLREQDIETAVNYPANHQHSLYQGLATAPLPVTEKVCGQILTLPMHCALSDEQVEFIIAQVQACLA
ncbi:MAG: DegT/DnrJ/EryC1/StrS family aminotransferase [Desulfarculaceae bacterium]|nr:DegT/DnrJ/EryC1/StrS family aminotransferase [Desulfarculaceae bacterium]MCF8046352.1 DegT/DnrJ/EryC1/StrS family aminotransferase [Desulfarculaceae bacterium]MCF8124065.1 DegT/DnrJ/EryC1/StrS family aminotransferase [Desulfarculaceae bacterium]